MKKLMLLAALIVATVSVSAQNVGFQYEDAVNVNGRAERKITPDQIHVAITLKDNEPKGATVASLETRMKNGLKALGIDVANALKVTTMTNAPRKRNQVDTQRSYELKVGSATTLASVFELLGEMGVTTANVVKISHSRIEQFRSDVRVEAIKAAQSIASELASAVGQKVGAAVWIQDGGFYENSPVPMYKTRVANVMMRAEGDADMAEDQSLEMQDITLTYNVMAKFILLR